MTGTPSAWMVLKFGGTSVSSLANWTNIARVVASRQAGGARVLIVHSALAGITDRVDKRVRNQGKRGKAAWSRLEEVLADRKLEKDLKDFDEDEF